MTIPDSGAVTVTTTATALHDVVDAYGRPYRLATVTVQNVSASTDVYVKGVGVTTANGYKLAAGKSRTWIIGTGDRLYGVVASGTAECRVVLTELNGV